MTDDLYERYKEALRVGHVAVLRGSLTAAIDAYREAAEIAPSRALPHTSLGGVLLRLGRLEEALVEYASAVARAPRDEGALLGQAEALSAAGERAEAASALDRVAEIQAESGRLPEAADTLRRAIEFHETTARVRRQNDLLREIRLSDGDQAAEQLLARALRLRDEPAVPVRTAARHPTEPAETPSPAPQWVPTPSVRTVEPVSHVSAEAVRPVQPETLPRAVTEAHGHAVGSTVGSTVTEETDEPEDVVASEVHMAKAPVSRDVAGEIVLPSAEQEPVSVAVSEQNAAEPAAEEPAEPGLVGVMDQAAGEAEGERQPTGDDLLAAAEAAEAAGNTSTLHARLLDAARAYASESRLEAALDATHRLLRSDPSDVEAHLLLVQLYMARDWNTLAAEKLQLLERLAILAGDEDAHRQICGVAASAFPRDERFVTMCA